MGLAVSKTIDELIQDLDNSAYYVRENAARELAERKDEPNVKAVALPKLKTILPQENDYITKGHYLDAIVQIETDNDQLKAEFENYINNPSLFSYAFRAIKQKPEVGKQFLDLGWTAFNNSPTYEFGRDVVELEFYCDKNLQRVDEYLVKEFETSISASLLLLGIVASDRALTPSPIWFLNKRIELVDKVWTILKEKDVLTVVSYSYWCLQQLIGPENSANDLLGSQQVQPWKKEYLKYLYYLEVDYKYSGEEVEKNIIGNGYLDKDTQLDILYLNYAGSFDIFSEGIRTAIVNYLVKKLKRREKVTTSSIIKWVDLNVNSIRPNLLDTFIEELGNEPSGELDTEKKAREDVVKKLKQRRSFTSSYELIITQWETKQKDIDILVDAIKNLLVNPTKRTFISLFDTCQEWIVFGRDDLVESLFEEMGNRNLERKSIQYLSALLSKDITRDQQIRELIKRQFIPDSFKEVIKGEKPIKPNKQFEFEKSEWRDRLKNENEKLFKLFEKADLTTVEDLTNFVNTVISEYINIKQIETTREVSARLAEMSDENLIAVDDSEQRKNLDEIKSELRRYTVPVVAKKIISEKDTEIRENFTRILGNVGGREAVDALTRAISGDERNRSARQELLARYYLDPSKTRSDEAANMLKEAIDEAKKTLQLLKITNVIVFGVGIILLLGGITIGIAFPDVWTKLIGALASIGGLAGIIVNLIKAPLERIQTAMSHLVQIETAFTSFIWELNLNGTYIQSQYVAEGILQDEDVGKTVSRIENAMGLAMNLVSVYTHNGDGSKGYLRSLSPSVVKAGSEVKLRGECLKGISSDAKENGIIAIDHEPVNATIKGWGNQEVSFILPPDLAAEVKAQTYKISLFVDGVETNSLPLKVLGKQIMIEN